MQIDKNNWQILVTEDNKKELEDYFIPKRTYTYFLLLVNSWYGLIDGEIISRKSRTPYLKCIDIYQFRKYILGKEDDEYVITKEDNEKVTEYLLKKYGIKENRKIIGYKAPFDIYDGDISKKDMLIKTGGCYSISGDIANDLVVPSELVEAYFDPVYEEEEKVIELHGYRITFSGLAQLRVGLCVGKIAPNPCYKLGGLVNENVHLKH